MAYESTRISYTDPSPYDQAFVISQGVVNEAFGFLHDNSKDTDAIRYYKQNIRVESIEMNLDAPAIEIQAIGNDPQVYLMIYISSGTLEVYQSDGGDDLAKYDLTGWKLAYPVKFGAQFLLPSTAFVNGLTQRRQRGDPRQRPNLHRQRSRSECLHARAVLPYARHM